MSWKEFRFNLRAITLLAVGCVVFTTVTVAAASHFHWAFPAVGFVFVLLISPPDAVAPLAIAERMQLPRRLLSSSRAKGLRTTQRRLSFIASRSPRSAPDRSRRRGGRHIRGDSCGRGRMGDRGRLDHASPAPLDRDPGIEFMLSILTPFIAYWPPEQLGGSGVLATVAAGLYVSWNGSRLIPAGRDFRASGLGLPHLSHRGPGLLHHWLAGARGYRRHSPLHDRPTGFRRRLHLCGRHRSPLRSDVSRDDLPRRFVPAIRRKDPSPP